MPIECPKGPALLSVGNQPAAPPQGTSEPKLTMTLKISLRSRGTIGPVRSALCCFSASVSYCNVVSQNRPFVLAAAFCWGEAKTAAGQANVTGRFTLLSTVSENTSGRE
jgi:hypothetical protein